MNRIITLFAILFLIITLAACGKKKPPQPSAYQGKKILTAVRDLERAYEKEDLGGFMDLVSKAYADRESLERSIKETFSRYEGIRFNFQGTKMLVMVPDRGNMKAAVNWDGEWRKAGGGVLKDGGRITLVFDPKDFLLLSIEGKNPFVPVEKQGK